MAAVNEVCKQAEELSETQSLCLSQLRRWVEEEAEFKGRTDDDFLIMFLYSCEFDLELTKSTLILFYDNRRHNHRWWANKNLKDPIVQDLINLKVITCLKDFDSDQPAVDLVKLSRIPKSPSADITFDSILRVGAIVKEVDMRRWNSQRNGLVVIFDFSDYPWWFIVKFIAPSLVNDLMSGFYVSVPARVQKIVLFNASTLILTGYKMMKPFLSESVQNKVHVCGYNLNDLHQVVPKKLLPIEYGGYNGSMEEHEDFFIKEILSFADYFEDDNQYGYS